MPLVTAKVEEAVPREGTTWGRAKLEKAFTFSAMPSVSTATLICICLPTSASSRLIVRPLMMLSAMLPELTVMPSMSRTASAAGALFVKRGVMPPDMPETSTENEPSEPVSVLDSTRW